MSAPVNPVIDPRRLVANDRVAGIIETLDRIGFDIGDTRVSLWTAVLVVIVVIGVFAVARLGNRIARRTLGRIGRLDPAQKLLGEKVVSIIVWTVAILIGIDLLGINLTAFAFFSGAAGLAVGFGLQKTFGNLIAGIILLMDRSIKPGDVIAVNDGGRRTVGQVKKIGIRAVSVITRDAIEYLIPNEILMTSQVENWSYSSRDVRVKVPLGVGYSADIDLAEKLILEAVADHPRVLASPPPTVWLMAFGDNAIEYELRIWINDPENGLANLRSDLLKKIWRLFREADVQVPYPQRDIHIKEWPGNPPPGSGQ